MKALRVTLCDLLKVVSITLEADDNAQVIFETLNARGTPLLALDLVKNSVFLEANRQGLETDELYEERWKPEFDAPEMERYWRASRRQGRLMRPVAELFLMHWLTMRTERVVPATELFTTFRARVLNAPSDGAIDTLIDRLCRDAKTMRGFDDLPEGSVEATFFKRLETLDTTTLIPLVLAPLHRADRRSRAPASRASDPRELARPTRSPGPDREELQPAGPRPAVEGAEGAGSCRRGDPRRPVRGRR